MQVKATNECADVVQIQILPTQLKYKPWLGLDVIIIPYYLHISAIKPVETDFNRLQVEASNEGAAIVRVQILLNVKAKISKQSY